MSMTEPFGHEKLLVYQKGMRFVELRSALLDRLGRHVPACDHLERGAESIPVNIARASNTWLRYCKKFYENYEKGNGREKEEKIGEKAK